MTWLAFAASCALTLLLQGHSLLRPMLITDDIAQHHVWLDAGPDSGYQAVDPWLETSSAIQPYMTAVVFQVLRAVFPTLLVGKVLALGVLALTGFLLFLTGARLHGLRLGWLALGFFFLSDAWIGISGGFARTFAWPLVCGFLLSMMTGARAWAAGCLFLAAALYPVVFVLLCPVYALLWVYEESAAGGWRRFLALSLQLRLQWPVLVAVVAGSVLVLLKSRELSLHPWVGPQVSLADIQADPMYQTGGRVPLWPPAPLGASVIWSLMPWDKALLEPVLRHSAAMPASLRDMVSSFLCLVAGVMPVMALVLIFRRCRRNAIVLLALAFGAAGVFLLAEALLPRLYEPSRYLTWSFPVLAVLSAAIVSDAVLGLLPAGIVRKAGVVVLSLVLASRSPGIRGKGAEDVSEYTALYTELARTGGGELIACFPRTGDFIPLLSHRSVFISNESSHGVLFSRYRRLVVDRHHALLDAFYSPRQEDMRAFCSDNGISWLVVEEKYYRQDMPSGVHFAPFEAKLREMLKRTPQPWLLTHARKSGKKLQPGVYLLNTGPILDSPAQP